MKLKLNSILLVDDDEAANFLHTMIIKQLDCTENIITKENGVEALDYLRSTIDGIYPQPDLILLDINMPIMDGWEFLGEYEKLKDDQLAKIVIVMLTTSLNPDDRKKAEVIPDISGFISKPLSRIKLEDTLEKHFKASKEVANN